MGFNWQSAFIKAAFTACIFVLVSFAGAHCAYAQTKPTHTKKVLETKKAQSYPKNTKFKGRKRPPRKKDHHNDRREKNLNPPGRGSDHRGRGKKRRDKGGILPKSGDRPEFGGEMPRSKVPPGSGTGNRGSRRRRRQETNDRPATPANEPVFNGYKSRDNQKYSEGTTYQGSRNPRKKQASPGTKFSGDIDVLSLPKNDMYQQQKKTTYLKYEKKKGPARGTRFEGTLKYKDVSAPEGHPGADFEGDIRMRKKKPQQSKGTTFSGHLDRRDYEPDLKKQKRMASYTGTVKARSEKQKDRYYKKLSGDMSNYTGDFKIKRRKYKDMHPSASHRYAKNIDGRQNRERFRKFRLWWTGLWKKSEQPDAVTEKQRRPRYDKGESEIWND